MKVFIESSFEEGIYEGYYNVIVQQIMNEMQVDERRAKIILENTKIDNPLLLKNSKIWCEK